MSIWNIFRRTAVITLPNGSFFDIINPDPNLIDIEDVATSLGNLCRFNGLCDEFYSIAEHSINVAKLLEIYGHDRSIVLAGLLHDSAEFVTGDCITPLKKYLGSRFKNVEHNVEKAICKRFGVDLFKNKIIIKYFDKVMYGIENDALKNKNLHPIIKNLNPKQAREAFLNEFSRLKN
jgi:hypothetical protein